MHYNACAELLDRNLSSREDRISYIDDCGCYTYRELAERVNRFANVLTDLGLEIEARALLCLQDNIDFPVAALGAIRAGVVPVMVNTLLHARDYDFMLRDSRARVLIVSAALLPAFSQILPGQPFLKHVIISGSGENDSTDMAALMAQASSEFSPAPTVADDACLWQYSSGSTGNPKGTVHIHGSLTRTAELYGRGVLGLTSQDMTFSAAKIFFGYGFGNSIIFPLASGATAVLMAERPTPQAVFRRLLRHQPTVFYGVPTLYASMLTDPGLPQRAHIRLRACVSAGEALPPHIGERWRERFGVDVLDGIGATEMLHIFLSNRLGNVRYGTTGLPVPGYELRLIGPQGTPVSQGEVGELQVSGPTSAAGYWNNRSKTHTTFLGPWTRTGDQYRQDEGGYYVYCGRSDDVMKVSGIYVSAFEVETALLRHPAVQEAAVVAQTDEMGLVKPKAFVVLKPGAEPCVQLIETLKLHAKNELAPYKYPRWIEFVTELPKTVTGKVQRFKLKRVGCVS